MTNRKRSKPLETEAMIQARIVQFLELRGWFCFENRSGKMNALAGRMSGGSANNNGSPDLFCWKLTGPCYCGFGGCTKKMPRHFAVECKRPGGKCSQAQLDWAGKFCQTGHLYILAYSHEDVEKALHERGWL